MTEFNNPYPDIFDPLTVMPDVDACDRVMRISHNAQHDRPDMPMAAFEIYTDLIRIAEKRRDELENTVIDGEIIL